MNVQRRPTSSIVKWALGVSLLIGGLKVFADYYAVCPFGSSSFLSLSMFFLGLPLLICMVTIPVAAACCFSGHWRPLAIAGLVFCLIFVCVGIISLRLGDGVRMRAFSALAERSMPLVDAIKAYEEQHGQPPPSLDAIVPEFLAAIPQTEMGAYPKYIYFVAKQGAYDGNPWMLTVFAPTGVLNFDKFIYYPSQNYPATLCRNRLERVCDWAYVHD